MNNEILDNFQHFQSINFRCSESFVFQVVLSRLQMKTRKYIIIFVTLLFCIKYNSIIFQRKYLAI